VAMISPTAIGEAYLRPVDYWPHAAATGRRRRPVAAILLLWFLHRRGCRRSGAPWGAPLLRASQRSTTARPFARGVPGHSACCAAR